MVKGDQPGPNIDLTVFLEDLSVFFSGLDTSACSTGLLLQQFSIMTPVRRLTAWLLRQQFSFTYPIRIFDCDKSIPTYLTYTCSNSDFLLYAWRDFPLGNLGLTALTAIFYIGLITTVLTSQAALPTYFNISDILASTETAAPTRQTGNSFLLDLSSHNIRQPPMLNLITIIFQLMLFHQLILD